MISRIPGPRCSVWLSLAAVLALACVSAPSAAAMSSSGELSPSLTELAKPSVRALPPAAQARELGIAPSGPGSLLREGNRVLVDVRFDHGAIAGLSALRSTGAQVIAASQRYQTVTVAATPASLPELAQVAGAANVSENRAPIIYGAGESSPAAVGVECEGGSVISEGAGPPQDQLHVAAAHSKYGVNGSGITVGVLSDSFDKATTAEDESGPIATKASDDVKSGDLPGATNPCSGQKTTVNVLPGGDPLASSQATDEGRAMLQIVHDVAPNASLAFATAFNSEVSFAHNIEALAKPVAQGGLVGANVIVDDVSWFEEPFFQDGPIAAAVNKVTAEGVAYVSAAGNNNLFEGTNEIASWEAPSFRESSNCPAALLALPGFGEGHDCMNFNPKAGPADDTFGVTVEEGATLTVDLQWAEPWLGVATDLDAYLLDSEGNPIVEEEELVGSGDNNVGVGLEHKGGTQRPVEIFQWKNTGASKKVQLVVDRCSSTCNPEASAVATPRLKFVLLENGRGVTQTEYPKSSEGDTVGPTIFGHNGADAAISVGAIHYNNNAQPEEYSSRGPVTHYFGPATGPTPAAPLLPAETISKPDIVATDCGETTFFAHLKGTAWRFCGTSASAPHAAGVAALELDADSSLSPQEVRDAQTETATPIGSFGPNAVGAGLLDADAALTKLLPSSVVITKHPASRTSETAPTFEFTVSPSSSLSCSVDGPPESSCSSPYSVPGPLADGPHIFEVKASGGDKASFSFTVDTTPPAIKFTQLPAKTTADSTPAFGFSASEPSGFTCSIDEAPAKACTTPYTASSLADGSHALKVTGTDQVGNSGSASAAFTVDTHAPTVTLFNLPPEKTADKTLTFEFKANEPAAFTCSVDEASPQPCSSPHVPAPLADGPHTFRVIATDLAGNVGTATAASTVDTKRPNTFFSKHPRTTLRTRQRKVRVTFRFGSNEAGVTFICKVDGGLLRYCDPTISRRFEEGLHTIRVKARDDVGNVDRTPAVFHFQVKRVGRR